MKVGLLIQNNLWFCPYVNIYRDLLEEWAIPYEKIYWNRDNNPNLEGIEFNGGTGEKKYQKIWGYISFSNFIKKIVSKKRYDRIIVFSPQIGIFISNYLSKHYKNKYIFDYRDLSIEQNGLFQYPFKKLLRNSFANVISSPGFKRYLPPSEYYISHNFIIKDVINSLNNTERLQLPDIKNILTIGGIRDFESNSKIIKALSNNKEFFLKFVGRGPAKKRLEEYSSLINTENIEFEGFYNKKDEGTYIKESTYLNIFYPDLKSHSSALSNRFYNSLIYRRPMIVTKGQIQGDFAEKYNVGISISDAGELTQKIKDWENGFNYHEYNQNCIKLLSEFIRDYENFKLMLHSFLFS